MVGVSQYDLGLDILFQFALVYGFHRSGSTNWHENRRLNHPMIRFYHSGSGFRMGIFDL
ncbi:hypothetical protein D3C87_1795050 [compost metagenome]